MLNTIARTGKILGLFSAERPEWGVTEVATTLALPKSNAYDVLSSLAAIGLLQRTPENRYRLGWRLLSMGRNLVQGTGFRQQTTLVVDTITRHLGVASTLATWDGYRIVCVASATTPVVRLPDIGTGARLPGHSTALGKMILSHRPWDDVLEKIEFYGLPKLTADTVSDLDTLHAQLQEARSAGVAADHGETYPSICCVAAPIFDPRGFIVAAVSISCPTNDMDRNGNHYARTVRAAARRLSAGLVADEVQAESDTATADHRHRQAA